MWPQSNQRGIETLWAERTWLSAHRPQSNQRGIETALTQIIDCRRFAEPQSNQRGIETRPGGGGFVADNAASIEPAWD